MHIQNQQVLSRIVLLAKYFGDTMTIDSRVTLHGDPKRFTGEKIRRGNGERYVAINQVMRAMGYVKRMP